jgi:hypothetical protein
MLVLSSVAACSLLVLADHNREWVRDYCRSISGQSRVVAAHFFKENSANSFGMIVNYASPALGLVGVLIPVLGMRFLNSPKSAELFGTLWPDPVEEIRRYFSKFVARMNSPLFVFVDDLDRCRADYAVSLLEQLQIVFNSPRVIFLVAADRHWISTAFEKNYGEMGKDIEETGRSVGYSFLEKFFKMSIGLPQLSVATQRQFFDHLLELDNVKSVEAKEDADEIKAAFKEARTDADVFGIERNLLSKGYDARPVSAKMLRKRKRITSRKNVNTASLDSHLGYYRILA